MSNFIIDYIGGDGIDHCPIDTRQRTPKPGDAVQISRYEQYPFLQNRFAYIAGFDGDEVILCIGSCSKFLQRGPSVSISGGPFHRVHKDCLVPTFRLQTVRFWNWGNNSPGAAQGVYYGIDRPVFDLYLPEDDHA